MSEQGEAPDPAVAGPEGTPGTAEQQTEQEVDWAKRYSDLQPEYTRAHAGDRRTAASSRSSMTSCSPLTTRTLGARSQQSSAMSSQRTRKKPTSDEDPLEHVRPAARTRRTDPDRTRAGGGRARPTPRRSGRSSTNSSTRLSSTKDDQDWVLAYAVNALPITEEGLPDIEPGLPGVRGAGDRTPAQLGEVQAGSAHLASRAVRNRGTQPRRPPTAPGVHHAPHAGRARSSRHVGAGPQPLPV